MQIKLTHNTPTNVTLAINADAETLENIKSSTVRKLSKNIKVPGFRAGKAPLHVTEKHLDQNILQSEFIDAVLNHSYISAVTKENIRIVGQPKVELKKFVPFTTFEFEIIADVIGDVKLPDYSKLKKTLPKPKVTTEDIKGVIESLRTRVADKKPSNTPAKNGDEVIIDFKGSDLKGLPVKGADGKDYPLALGSDTFIPGFEKNLIGLKKGESKSFKITFPKDYQVKALQSKVVSFDVTVKTINAVELPKVDDVFASKAGPFKTLDELKKNIKEQLEYEQQNDITRKFENELLEEIASKAKVEIPDQIIDDQVLRAEQNEKQNLVYRGQTWQEHLDEEGLNEEEHRKNNRKDAADQVKVGIVLGAIGDKEKIDITPEELEIRIQLLKGQYTDPKMQEELDKPEGRQDIASRLRTEKIIAHLTKLVS